MEHRLLRKWIESAGQSDDFPTTRHTPAIAPQLVIPDFVEEHMITRGKVIEIRAHLQKASSVLEQNMRDAEEELHLLRGSKSLSVDDRERSRQLREEIMEMRIQLTVLRLYSRSQKQMQKWLEKALDVAKEDDAATH